MYSFNFRGKYWITCEFFLISHALHQPLKERKKDRLCITAQIVQKIEKKGMNWSDSLWNCKIFLFERFTYDVLRNKENWEGFGETKQKSGVVQSFPLTFYIFSLAQY